MMANCRTLTLRGELAPFSAEIPLDPQQIFAYESAGQKRAWKVTSWSIWPTDFGDNGGWYYGSKPVHKFVLATDSGANALNLLASENRAIGWTYITSDVGKTQTNLSPIFEDNMLDPDHLVTGQLFISADALVYSADNSLPSTWSYMIKLESRQISSAESIMQSLKGRGQDVTT